MFGIEAYPGILLALGTTIDAAMGRFPIVGNTAASIEGGAIHLLIEDEIVYGTVSGGIFTADEVYGRGALGSSAKAHRAGVSISALRSAIFTVERVTAREVHLNKPLPRSFAGAPFRVGSVGGGLSGRFEIAGGGGRGDVVSFHCLAATLARGFTVEGQGSLSGGSHGGFIAFGAMESNVRLNRISGCGRPDRGLGGSVWIFGRSQANRVDVGQVVDGHAAWLIDDKSFGLSYYGLEGAPHDNVIAFADVTAHDLEGQLTGGINNRVEVGRADTRKASVIIDTGVSQVTDPRPPRGNVITTSMRMRPFSPQGDGLMQNRVSSD
ncbi:hypothetical protein [Sphingomonas sp. J315]|uniref:hypothetical protein n=1 Tax=Sphingomonas sp. J315 TaxID=2898433 RepID=UPI0021AE290C|nr:hypothetical protein [Sphingomonas sp. J315]UUY00564.1 hypothetical protein LRS08_05620 [Sphingomonas sp. J315]